MAAKKRKYVEVELTPERIAEVIYKANKPVKLDEILAMLKVKRQHKRDVELFLQALELDGRLVRSRGTWFPPKNRPLVQGTLSIQRSGAGFVIPEGTGGGDVFIAPHDLKDAWDGDIVEVLVMPHRQGPSREGRITRIIERSQKLLPVFALRKQGDEWLATPQHSGLQVLFRVDVSTMGTTKQTPVPPTYQTGKDRATGKPASSASPASVQRDDLLLVIPLEKLGPGLWSARAVMNLYDEESPAAQELLAKIGHGIPMEFPPAVLKEVQHMPEDPVIDETVLRQREDLRYMPFVTIDGADAKDFDDAIYVERAGKGYRLLVAIADVSYYVTNTSAIDNEARRRGNSYYFPLSVEPMLPEVLSNGLCSLKPMVARLGVVADMIFSDKGVETSSKLYTAVVESKARLTYDQVHAAIIDEDKETQEQLQAHMPMLTDAFALAGLLSRQRSDRGSLDFELPEAQFVFDDKGDVADVVARTSTRANNLIEEFMIAANESVARYLTGRHQPLLYRIHEAPDMEKLEALKNFILQTHIIELPESLKGAGTPKPGRGSRQGLARKKAEPLPPSPQEFKAILQAAKNTPQEYIVNRLLLRAMMQARYSPDNEGHFGLASRCYCHFTSPIRRYADLVVHRALKASLGQWDDISSQPYFEVGQGASGTDETKGAGAGERALSMQDGGHAYRQDAPNKAVKPAKQAKSDTPDILDTSGASDAPGDLSHDDRQTVWVKEKEPIEGVSFDEAPGIFGLAPDSGDAGPGPDAATGATGAIGGNTGEAGSAGDLEDIGAARADRGRKSSKKEREAAKKRKDTPKKGKGVGGEKALQHLEQIADHINQTERSAMDAERETHKRLSALYLRNHVGEEFDGIVSGVTDFGIFIELPSCLSEGMVRLSSLDDDYYHYLPDRQMLRGERTGRIFTIGMPVRVVLIDVSLQRFEVTLEILSEEGEGIGKKSKKSFRAKSGSREEKTSENKKSAQAKDRGKGGRKKTSPTSRNGKKGSTKDKAGTARTEKNGAVKNGTRKSTARKNAAEKK